MERPAGWRLQRLVSKLYWRADVDERKSVTRERQKREREAEENEKKSSEKRRRKQIREEKLSQRDDVYESNGRRISFR